MNEVAVRDAIRRASSIFKERKAGEGTRPPVGFDGSSMRQAKKRSQGKGNGNVTMVFPEMGGVARGEPFIV